MERQHRTDDEFFKSLLMIPLAARDFLRFLAGGVVPGLDPDYATLEHLPNNFVTDEMRERRADAVMRALWRGTDCWTYFHLEFQSSCPWDMCFRIPDYRALLRRRLADAGMLRSPSGHVVAVLSVVVYSGKPPWRGGLDMADMAHPAIRALHPPEGGWCVVVGIQEIDPALLTDDGNLFVLFLRLERAVELEDMCRAMIDISERLPDTDEGRALRRILRRRVKARLMGQLGAEELQETLSLLDEDDPMFEAKVTDMVTRFRNRMFNEGKAEGHAEGKAEGKAEGHAEGFAEGEAKGIAEGEVTGALKNALKIARSLLGAGMAADFVVTHTGLPLADVERLAAEMR